MFIYIKKKEILLAGLKHASMAQPSGKKNIAMLHIEEEEGPGTNTDEKQKYDVDRLSSRELSTIVPYLTPFQDEDGALFVNCVVCAKRLMYGENYFKSVCLKIKGLMLCHPFCETCSLILPVALNCCSCNRLFNPTKGAASGIILSYCERTVASTGYACCSAECAKRFVKYVLKNACIERNITVSYECKYCKSKSAQRLLKCRLCKSAGYCGVECLRADSENHRTMCNVVKTIGK